MRIYKYTIFETMPTVMPKGAKILSVQVQKSTVTAWALVDPYEKEEEIRHFRCYATGEDFNPENDIYLATVQDGPFVWHVWELVDQ